MEHVPADIFLRLTEASGAHGFIWDAERDEVALSAGWTETLGCPGCGRPSSSRSWHGLLASVVAAPADAVALEAWASASPRAVLVLEIGVLTQAAPGPVPALITAGCYGEGGGRRLAGSVRLLQDAAAPERGYRRGETEANRAAAREQKQELSRALAANQAKSAFLANMSHEMRTPLNGIIGVNQVLLSSQLELDQRELVELIQSSADSLLKLINDILDLERIESGQLELEPLDFDIATTVEESLDTVMMVAAKKGLDVISYIDPDIDTLLRGDSGRIKQILLNLLSNAIKFTKAGEIVVSCEKDTIETDNQVSVLIKVTDSGIGISKAAQARLFNRFTQAEASTTRRFGGTGLGLAICKQLVGMMRGSIGVHSDPGQGSTFWFTMVLEKLAPIEPLVAGGASPLLVVATHPRERAVLEAYLQSFGTLDMSIMSDLASASAFLGTSPHPRFRALVASIPTDEDSTAALLAFCQVHRAAIGCAVVLAPITALSAMREKRRDWMVLSKPIKRGTLAAMLRNIAEGEYPVLESARCSPPPKANVLLAADGPPCPGLQDMIIRAGYTCDVTSNASDALAAIKKTNYSAVLMDKGRQPGMTSTSRDLRNMEAELQRGRVPVIGVRDGSGSDGDNSFVDDIIQTPVDEAELGAMLKKWTRSSQLYATLLRTGIDKDSMRHDTAQQTQCGIKDNHLAQQVRILLAEDSPANQLILVRTITSVGRKLLGKEPFLVVVGDGDEAVRAADESPFDLVLMDLNMPCMGGVEATRFIRQKCSRDELPIVALTAADNVETLCLESQGFNAAVNKPLAPATLMNLLQEHLRSIPHNSSGQPARLSAGYNQAARRHSRTSADPRKTGSNGNLPWASSKANEKVMSSPRRRKADRKTGAFWQAYEKKEHKAEAPQTPRAVHVLLVEDSIANQLMMQRSIKQNGRELLGSEPELTTCGNGAEALREMEKQQFDMVFMDLHMPVMGGLLAVKEIRKTYTKEALPVVAITGSEDPATADDPSSSRIMGDFSEIVAKPTSNENMKAIIHRHLIERRQHSDDGGKPAGGHHLVMSSPRAAEWGRAAAKPIRCLVVEDDKASRVMIARLLKAAGIMMLEAHNGLEGVQHATSSQFDIILMDCNMPVKDGLQATQEIRAWEEATGRQRTPIIAVTARAMSGDRERCLEVGMDDHVPKPLKNTDLMHVISKCLKGNGAAESMRPTTPARSDGSFTSIASSRGSSFTVSRRNSSDSGTADTTARYALLVDESLATAVDTQSILEAEGFVVDVAENGLQAAEAFEDTSAPAYEVILLSGGLAITSARNTASAIVSAAERRGRRAPPLVLLRQAAAFGASSNANDTKSPAPKPAVRSSLDVQPPFKYVLQLPVQVDQLSMVLTGCNLKSSGTLPDVSRLRPYNEEALIGKLCLVVDSSADGAAALRSMLRAAGVDAVHLADPSQLKSALTAKRYSAVLLHHRGSSALLSAIRAQSASLPVIVLPTARGPRRPWICRAAADPSKATLAWLPYSARRASILGALFRLTSTMASPEDTGQCSSFQPQPPLELAKTLALFQGDWPLALESLQAYAAEIAPQLAAVTMASSTKDMEALQALTRSLAASSRSCGIGRVAHLCDRVAEVVERHSKLSPQQTLGYLTSHLQSTLLETAAFVSSLSCMATMDIARGLAWASGDLDSVVNLLLGDLQFTWSELQDKEGAIRGGDIRVVIDITAGLMGPEVIAAAPRLYAAACEARQMVQAEGNGHNALRLLWRELERLRIDIKLLRGTAAVQVRRKGASFTV